MPDPALDAVSLGAGVQSTTLMLLAEEGRLPRPDVGIFADTGWEPAVVYEHLARLEAACTIPIVRVKAPPAKGRPTGDLRADSLTVGAFVRMPVFVADRTGLRESMVRRQCTEEYKLKPLKAEIRRRLGYPHPRPVPRGVVARQWIGISRDEVHRAKDPDVRYLANAFPLLGIGIDVGLVGADGRPGWTRQDCVRYLEAAGWGSTPKSACIGCPFHGNRQWRDLRDNHPAEWADAVAFDRALRQTRLRGIRESPFLHRSLLPLDEAPIDRVTASEWRDRQASIFDADVVSLELLEDGPEHGCSPVTCRSGDEVAV